MPQVIADDRAQSAQGADQTLLEKLRPESDRMEGVRHEVFRCGYKIKDISPSSNSSHA
jgi:hypothetical protein